MRAVDNGDGLAREGAAVGFHVVRRRAGDVFEINRWEEFSPRWMEFVGSVSEGWQEHIDAQEADRSERLRLDAIEQAKKPGQLQGELIELAVKQTLTTLSEKQSSDGKAIPSHEFQQGKRTLSVPAKA